MEWSRVLAALRAYGAERIALGAAFVLPACLAAASFDLVGRHATPHQVPVPRTMPISYAGYFFSLNLGALVGGLAFRYRLYVPYRLALLTVTQVIGLSVLTNWMGYVLLAGGVLLFEPPRLPAIAGLSGALLRAAAAAYLVLCALRGGTRLRFRDSELALPTVRIALLQLALSVASWAGIGAIITALLPGEVSWLGVMRVLMVSALAGIWSHVPGGLGVVEAVFLALLGGSVPASGLLAAILVYRLLYYLAVAVYLYLEASSRRPPGRSGRARQPEARA